MKRLLYIIVPILLSSACSRNAVSERLAEVDSLVAHEQYESADVLLSKIDTVLLSDINNKAHFYLLQTQLTCILHKDDNLSMLDSLIIPYYDKTKDCRSLANAYYYKGYGQVKVGKYAEAIYYLKKAEEQSMATNDVKLKYKIAESLSYINEIVGNYQIQLHYALKALSHVQGIDNKKWKADALFSAGLAYSRLMREDSTLYYLSKMEPLLEYIPQSELSSFLVNVAYLYKHTNPPKAKDYLKRSLTLEESSLAFEHLADIYYDEGDQEEAYRLWKKALSASGRNPRDNIIHNLLEYDIEHGKTDNVCKQVNEIIAIKDSIINALKNDTIKDLQLRYDQEVAMRKHEQTVGNWQTGLLVAAILVLWLVAYIIINRYREKSKMMDFQMQMNDLMAQIRELKASGRQDSETINMLNRQLKDLIDKEDGRLKDGMKLYNNILNGGNVSSWRKKDFALFIDYYKAIDFKTVRRLEETPRKEKLTEQKLFFLLLKEMEYDKSEIANILGISITSVNTLNTRTKPIE